VHADTVVTTWIVMIFALAFFAWIGASYRSAYQTKRQVVVEGVVNYIADLATSTLGPKGEPFVPFFIALFVFIFLLNQFGMLPFKAFGLPFGGSPTADVNTTVPLALIVVTLTWVVGFRMTGWARLRHLFQPFPVLFPINVIDEIVRFLILQHLCWRTAIRHRRLDHRGESNNRSGESLTGSYGCSVFHSVFQFFRRHRAGVRLHAVGDRLPSSLNRRRTLTS
jgi:hypothetical protein